jgi:hypothetical protein
MSLMRWWPALLVGCGSPQPVATVQPVVLPPAVDAAAPVSTPLPESRPDALAECTAPGIESLFTDSKMRPIPLTPAQLAQVANKSADPEIAYARARSYFEARHWDEAALAFRPLALDPKANDLSVYGAMLYLECLNVLLSHGRTRCYEQMQIDIPAIRDNVCTGPNAQADQCDIITRISKDLMNVGLGRAAGWRAKP